MNLRRLGRPTGHRKALFRNLVTDSLNMRRSPQRRPRQKRSSLVEKMIVLGKKETLVPVEVAKVIMDEATKNYLTRL